MLTSVALTSVLDELAPMFEKATGTKLSIDLQPDSCSAKAHPRRRECRRDYPVTGREGRAAKARQNRGKWPGERGRHLRFGGGSRGSAKARYQFGRRLTLDLLSMRTPQEVAAVSISHVSSIVSA
jgi:hypothetical protein